MNGALDIQFSPPSCYFKDLPNEFVFQILQSTLSNQGERPNIETTYRVFQKDLYNFESLYKFIQRTYAVFSTVTLYKITPNFIWDIYGSM
jgi:hypothetical protein